MAGTPLRELFARFTTEFDTSALVKGSAAVDGLFGKLSEIGSALAGGAIVTGLVGFTNHVIEQGDALATTAERIGITTEELQEWTYVADLADVSAEELGTAFKFASKNIYEAANGGKEAAETFAKLGIKTKDANGDVLQTGDLIEQVADKFAEMNDPVEKTALALKIFGKGGQALVPLLNKGTEGIVELRAEFEALGGGLTDDTVAAANEADDAFKRLRFSVRGLTANAVTPFIKMATAAATRIKDWVVEFKKLSKGSEVVKATIIALSIAAVAAALPVLIAWAPVILTTLAWVAALTLAIAAIDDLITLFQGGKSVIGDWIEDQFGEGSTQKFVENMTAVWEDLKKAFEGVKEVAKGEMFADLKSALGSVADIIKAIVDGLKYIQSVRNGKTDLGQTWLGKVGRAIGLDDRTLSDKGATPLTSAIAERASRAEAGTALGSAGESSFFSSLPGSSSAYGFSTAEIAAPVVNTPASAEGAKIQQLINVTVAPEAKPDPRLVPMVKGAVKDALDQHARELAAGN